jgi:hypothetical protein
VFLIAVHDAAGQTTADTTVVRVFDTAAIVFDEALEDPTPRGEYVVLNQGRTLARTLQLPDAPADQRDARRIVATVTVRPVLTETDGRRPGDEWTRMGSLTVITSDDDADATEVELVRFTTGFGQGAGYSQDVTALAPLLAGRRELRLTLSTYRNPAWEVSVRLDYSRDGVGYRRPALAVPLFHDTALTADSPLLTATVEIPQGLSRPRVRLLSTGHSTDGGPENEFITCTHVLRIDGRRIISWRPWSEGGGGLRDMNPWAGRRTIDGREVWSSDLDRSGWQPGLVVEPLVVPVPELTPGPHEITLEVLGIRPEEMDHAHGYWRISGVVLADEPWPAGH